MQAAQIAQAQAAAFQVQGGYNPHQQQQIHGHPGHPGQIQVQQAQQANTAHLQHQVQGQQILVNQGIPPGANNPGNPNAHPHPQQVIMQAGPPGPPQNQPNIHPHTTGAPNTHTTHHPHHPNGPNGPPPQYTLVQSNHPHQQAYLLQQQALIAQAQQQGQPGGPPGPPPPHGQMQGHPGGPPGHPGAAPGPPPHSQGPPPQHHTMHIATTQAGSSIQYASPQQR
jgi:hypothetical protein